jgi:hypothetical protein
MLKIFRLVSKTQKMIHSLELIISFCGAYKLEKNTNTSGAEIYWEFLN